MLLFSEVLPCYTVNMQDVNTAQIKQTIQTYVEGYLNAEKSLVGKAFNPGTCLFSVDDGKIDKTELADWFTNLDSRKEKGDLRQAKLEVALIDITDQAAIAKIHLYFEKFQFTDYLSLLRTEGEWKIVGKIYSVKALS